MTAFESLAQPFEADQLARHAELLGLGAAGGDELAGAGGVAGGVAVEEHLGPGAPGADDVGARAEALVHRQRLGDVALGVVEATEAGGEHATELAVGPVAVQPRDAWAQARAVGAGRLDANPSA